MELSKQDTKMTKGLAIIFMVLLHLFCRLDNLPYECLKIQGGVPLVYYIALFGDQCVAIYCFCSGYALYLLNGKSDSCKDYYKKRIKSLFAFLMNYWIVLSLFSVLGLFFDKTGSVPGNIVVFIKHFFIIDNSYNGAWWFVFTYVLLILVSRPSYYFVKKVNPVLVLIGTIILYIVSYYQRTTGAINTNNLVVNWIIEQFALFGTSFFPYIVAMMFQKYKVFTKIRIFVQNHITNGFIVAISAVIILAMIVVHGIVQSLIVAPITGIVTIVIFNIVNKGKFFDSIFSFFGNHSTNIWLVHMFFYSSIFKNLVFVAKYPIAIFLFMILLCIVSSYVINVIISVLNKFQKIN